MHELKTTLVKKGATLGANATIICGHTLGRYSFVGAGAVVTKDVADYALVWGSPARIKDWICECGIKLEFKKAKAICKSCKKEYKKKKDLVQRLQ
jgi:UDP-2-acetamido-3-amino-2,3-dideoxy-glucuronate N-acetyltransferase